MRGLRQRGQRLRDLGTGHDRGRGVYQQHGAGSGVAKQDLHGVDITLHRRVADDVHRVATRPVGRQHRIELGHGAGAEPGQGHVHLRGGVSGHDAGTAAVGQHGERRALVGAKTCQRLRGEKQFLQAVHPQHAGARDGGVVDRVGTRQRTGVRGGRPLALRRSTALDDDDRLVPRRSPGGRHELAWRLDRFDVEQDRARRGVGGQVIEHVAEVHVGMLAQRDEMREPDALGVGPVQHRGHQGARLRHKGQLTRPGVDVRKACVQPGVRREQADAVGAQHPQQMRARGRQHGLLVLGRQAGAQHHGGAGATRRQLGHQARNGMGWRADHRQFGNPRQIGHAGVAGPAIERGVFRIDRDQRTPEPASRQVAPHRGAHAGRPIGRADYCHRGRVEQGIEVADAHRQGTSLKKG